MRVVALVLVLISLVGLPGVLAAMTGQQEAVDPRRIAITAADLPPGFVVQPERTGYQERPDGVAVYEVIFARDPTPANLASGPIEIRNGVARTPSEEEAAGQYAAAYELFVASGWTETLVPPLGEESIGLSFEADVEGGRAAAHQYLFRKGAWVFIVGVGGRAEAVKLEDTIGLAIKLSDRLDAALAGARPPSPAQPPAPGAPGTPSRPGERVRVVNTDGASANVRAEPSTQAPVLAQAPEGTVLEIAGPDRQADGRTWRNVRLPDGRTGWIAGELLTTVAPPPAPSPSPQASPAPAVPPPADAPPEGPVETTPPTPVEPPPDMPPATELDVDEG